MFDRETVQSNIRKHESDVTKHFILALFGFWLAAIFGSIYLYHADWFFKLLGQNKALLTFAVPAVVITIHSIAYIAMFKSVGHSIFKKEK